MKKILTALCFLLIPALFALSDSQQTDKENWTRLDYMLRGTVPFRFGKEGIDVELTKWDSKVLVLLKGNYTISDSLELGKAMKAFNEVIPKPGFDWAGKQQASLIVQFTDLPYTGYLQHFNWYSNRAFNQKLLNHRFKITKVQDGVLLIDSSLTGEHRQTNIWHSFGKMLIECNGFGINLGKETVLGGKIRELTDFDRFFFSTIYAENFTDQYLKFIKEKYSLFDQYRYLTDSNTKNTIVVTLQLIFLFLLTYFFYQLVWVKYLEKRIKGKFARFHISGLVFFTPQILVSLIFIIPDLLKIQHFSMSLLLILIVGIVGFVLLQSVYFIFALVAYFIEHILFGGIHDFRQRQIVRIVSVSIVMMPLILLIMAIDRPQILIWINILVIILSFCLIIVIRFLYFHDQYQKEIIRKHQQLKIEKLEQLQTKFQLDAIQTRTNPHFLYNSLNTIAALAKQDAGKTEEFALKLSKLLRLRLIENSPSKLPLTEEIETIRLYLEIEKERFFDRLDYSVFIPENTEKLLVPTDILLYLVENSIKHGISKQVGKGIIKVEITTHANQIKMSVADNGPDFPENPIYGTGLKSILEKLDILYPDNYEFAIFNHPEKRVEITLNK